MSMEDNGVLAGLDLGTTRVRAVVAEPDGKGGVSILGYASLPAHGIVRGELTDLPAVAATIAEVIDRAARQAELQPTAVATSVAGDNVRSLAARGVVSLETTGATVRSDHLSLARQRVTSMGIPFDRVILHCLPVEYTLDDRSGLNNPVGMVGARLEMDAHLITGTQSQVSAIDRAVTQAGYRADPLVFGPCATSRYLVEESEREHGCLLIDIGGENTQYSLFYRGRMRQSGVVPIGGNHVTRDLAYGLGLDPGEAERIKRACGRALRSAVVAQPVAESGMSLAMQSEIAAICEARQMEVLELVANGLQWGISRPALAGGIVLTGGGSRLEGTGELAEQVFALRSTTRRAPGDDYGTEPDSWATVLGLVEHARDAEPSALATDLVLCPTHQGRIWDNVKRWIGKLV
jgi:cell division protein FtsA